MRQCLRGSYLLGNGVVFVYVFSVSRDSTISARITSACGSRQGPDCGSDVADTTSSGFIVYHGRHCGFRSICLPVQVFILHPEVDDGSADEKASFRTLSLLSYFLTSTDCLTTVNSVTALPVRWSMTAQRPFSFLVPASVSLCSRFLANSHDIVIKRALYVERVLFADSPSLGVGFVLIYIEFDRNNRFF